MSVFERQERVQRRSALFIALFACGVAGVVAALNFLTFLALKVFAPELLQTRGWLVISSLAALAIICGAALWRFYSLRGGGSAIAKLAGGTHIKDCRPSAELTRYRNVVEETAIAAGLPRPAIFVLENEGGINAFAAGFSPRNAAIAVTQGALDTFTRDELQAVVAHEFSHIRNGDMALNARLIGFLFGISIFQKAGGALVYAAVTKQTLFGDRQQRRITVPNIHIFIGAALLYLVGSLGAFFASLIQAAHCRQRELLADASAVQFTRNPEAMVSALAVISTRASGSALAPMAGAQISHLLFAQGALFSLFDTHPPILERILSLDPKMTEERLEALTHNFRPKAQVQREQPAGAAAPSAAAQKGALKAIPPALMAAAAKPEQALPICLSLFFSGQDEVAIQQRELVAQQLGGDVAQHAALLAQEMRLLPAHLRLPVAARTKKGLRTLPPKEAHLFVGLLQQLVWADGTVEPHEFYMATLMHRQVCLALQPELSQRRREQSASDLAPHLATLFSQLASMGESARVTPEQAWRRGMALAAPGVEGSYQPPRDGLFALGEVFKALDSLAVGYQRALIEGMAATALVEARATQEQIDLVRTVCMLLEQRPPLVFS